MKKSTLLFICFLSIFSIMAFAVLVSISSIANQITINMTPTIDEEFEGTPEVTISLLVEGTLGIPLEEQTTTPIIDDTQNTEIVDQTLESENQINGIITPTIEYTAPISEDIGINIKTKEIEKAIENAYDIENYAAVLLNNDNLYEVFINDPRFPLKPAALQVVRELTENPSLESAGYLDYKIAYHSWVNRSILMREELFKKAKSENRILSDDERALLKDKYGRMSPARISEKSIKTPITIHSIDLEDDIAKAVVKNGAVTAELTLVHVKDKWFIADSINISINP